jgi:hypothetical protein
MLEIVRDNAIASSGNIFKREHDMINNQRVPGLLVPCPGRRLRLQTRLAHSAWLVSIERSDTIRNAFSSP